MTRWHHRYFVTWGKDEQGWWFNHGPYVFSRTKLSNGQILRLEFTVKNWEEVSVIQPHLVVHNRFGQKRSWAKSGLPTGPGGMEVWSHLIDIWDSGVARAKKLATNQSVEVQVDAHTDALYRIYWRFLKPHGYRQIDDCLWKEL